MEKEILTYSLYDESIRKIAKWAEGQTFDGIYAPPKGGLPMAVHLCNLLDLPLLMYPTSNTLVVDDIADTGKTLENIKHKAIATIYYHKQSVIVPDFWVFEKTDKWIVYWWEQ